MDVLVINRDMTISLSSLSADHCRRTVPPISRHCPDNSDTGGDLVTGRPLPATGPVTVEVRWGVRGSCGLNVPSWFDQECCRTSRSGVGELRKVEFCTDLVKQRVNDQVPAKVHAANGVAPIPAGV